MKTGKIGKAINLMLLATFMFVFGFPISSYAYEGEQIKLPPTPPNMESLGAVGNIETIYNLWQLYCVKDKCPDYAKSEFEKKAKEEIIKALISRTNPVAQFLWFAGEAGEYAGNSLHYSDIQKGIERYEQIRSEVFGNGMPFDMKSIVDEVQFRNGMGGGNNFLQKAINVANGYDASKLDWTSADVTKGVAALEAVYQAQKWREQNLSSWEKMRQSIDNFLGNNPLGINVDVCARTKRNPGIQSSKYWDPNDMHIDPEGDGTSNWIRKDAVLKFTINFENIADATANVPFVNITMPLPDAVDGEKIKQLDSSFTGAVMIYDNKNRIVRWILNGINLPPAGQGYVRFEAPLVSNVAYGTEFTCEAKIYFGYNPPIATPPVTRRVAAPPVVKTLQSIAKGGKMNISWDIDKKSAIDHYDLFVSENGGKQKLLQRINRPNNENDPATKYLMPVKNGIQYKFAIEAVDKLAQSSGIKTQSTQPSDDAIKVYVNGKLIAFDVPPIIKNGRTLVPLRKIFEALGAEVNWDSKTKMVTGKRANTNVVLTINSTAALVNNLKKTLDVPAAIISGRTLVPARFISESLGANVEWDASTRTVTITLK
ncbi:MAG: copper amine oxidase N-terminal domain-containing protein [Clostridia bacterium]|nr:copper amine oxidase N-terminal domain-containing protein [Clostridia bacterium]